MTHTSTKSKPTDTTHRAWSEQRKWFGFFLRSERESFGSFCWRLCTLGLFFAPIWDEGAPRSPNNHLLKRRTQNNPNTTTHNFPPHPLSPPTPQDPPPSTNSPGKLIKAFPLLPISKKNYVLPPLYGRRSNLLPPSSLFPFPV